MKIEKLRKEDFLSHSGYRTTPKIRFSQVGLIAINKYGVNHLGLCYGKGDKLHGVSICYDKDEPCDFSIMRDDEGFTLRKNPSGQAVFNNVCLCRHIMGKTWEKHAHAVDAVIPKSISLLIAPKPLDDDKNKNVFALLRKKV